LCPTSVGNRANWRHDVTLNDLPSRNDLAIRRLLIFPSRQTTRFLELDRRLLEPPSFDGTHAQVECCDAETVTMADSLECR
jgi:hypothetical protein